MAKIGMTREAVHRQRYYKFGRFEDSIGYVIFRDEYERLQRQRSERL